MEKEIKEINESLAYIENKLLDVSSKHEMRFVYGMAFYGIIAFLEKLNVLAYISKHFGAL